MRKIVLGITGASGAIYAKRFLDLCQSRCELQIVVSDTAPIVFKEELDLDLESYLKDLSGVLVHENHDFLSPVASGSNPFDAFIVLPCSMKTLGQVRHGVGSTLLTRIADICLKERRKLIMVPREAPYSVVHLENMLRISELGGIITPASPGFYHRPEKIMDLVDFVVERVAGLAGIQLGLVKPWKCEE
jgi:flavin prenyltransferase